MNVKSILAVAAGAGASLALFTACQNDKEESYVTYMLPKTQKMTLTAEQSEQLRKNNDFAFDLLRHAYSTQEEGNNQGKSLFISPMGVTYMLGMLNAGANEEAQQEITQTLHAEGKSATEINQLCQTVMDQAPKVDPSVKVLTANSIYTDKNFEIVPQYQSDMSKYYQADARVLDFSQPSSINTINDWAKKKTEGMIPSIIDKFDARAACYLLNAVYFQATWTKQFDREETSKQPFTKANGEQTQLDMMHSKALLNAKSTDNSLMVRIGYGSDTWSMYVIMPKEGKSIDEVLGQLDASTLDQGWLRTTLDLQLPKFKTTNKIDLKQILPEMGLSSIFSFKGNLTGICKDHGLTVGKMYQSGQIDVNEEGTKATMVTVSELLCTSPGPGPSIEDFNGQFHANRPFIYLIREGYSGAIFFAGIYTGE